MAVSATGQIATASFDNSIGLWTSRTPKWLDGHSAAVNAVLFIEDSVILSGSDDFKIKAWVPEDGLEIEIGEHQGKITDIAAHQKTRQFATASWDGTAAVWLMVDHLATTSNPSYSFRKTTLKGHRQGVNSIAFSSDGGTVYTAASDGALRTWNAWNGTPGPILAKQGFGINELIVTDTWIAYGAVDGTTRILDHDGTEIADFTLDRRPILAMAYNAPTARLAVGDGEGFIMVIDTANWRIEKDFRATRRGPVWALAFSNNGQNIHAGGIDDIMYSWPVATIEDHDQMGTDTRSFLEDPATLSNGERQFKRKCSICHSLTKSGKRRAGPTLGGVFGRPAGTLEGYKYSATLINSDIVWTPETIDILFDQGPDHYIPGSKMPMQRITKSQDRSDLIGYLQEVTDQ
jgi:cytochrome c